MKVRVTIMTENDAHPEDDHTNEKIEAAAKIGWQLLLNELLMESDENNKAVVEKCEVIER